MALRQEPEKQGFLTVSTRFTTPPTMSGVPGAYWTISDGNSARRLAWPWNPEDSRGLARIHEDPRGFTTFPPTMSGVPGHAGRFQMATRHDDLHGNGPTLL